MTRAEAAKLESSRALRLRYQLERAILHGARRRRQGELAAQSGPDEKTGKPLPHGLQWCAGLVASRRLDMVRGA